jgi:hypothetical protein
VIQKLSDSYHHRIIYNEAEIAGTNFTGTVTHSDSLFVVLRLLATMNGLEVREEGSSYKLSKLPL